MDVLNLKPKKTYNKITIKKKNLRKLLSIPNHEIAPIPLMQRISWELDPGLQQGDFTSFAWLGPKFPADGVFGPPEISSDGNSITITAFNAGSPVPLEYPYVITLEIGTETYSTHEPDPELMVKDPIIINK